jgi:hypothetical protein
MSAVDILKLKKAGIPPVVGNQYHLTKKIGAGSFGEIFKAIVPGSGDVYAVKLEVRFFILFLLFITSQQELKFLS